MIIIDGKDMVLGRMASIIAKKLINGEEIVVVNAEKTIVVGSKDNILKQFKFKRALTHPRKGPYYPRMPDRIVKRTVRGMLPYQQYKGREALKRLKVYVDIPEEFKDKSMISFDDAKKTGVKYLTLKNISHAIGGMK